MKTLKALLTSRWRWSWCR